MASKETFWEFANNDTAYKRWLKWLGLTVFIMSVLSIIHLNLPFSPLPTWLFIVLPPVIAGLGFYLDSWRLYERRKKLKNQ